MQKLIYFSIIFFLSILFISCEETPEDDVIPENEDNVENDSVTTAEDYLTSESKYSQFLDLLKTDGEISSVLDDKNKDITVFALSNETINSALAELGIDSLNLLYVETLQQIVRYHLNATASLQREDFNADGIISTLQSENISFDENIQISSGGLDNAIQFIGEEIVVENGVIHEIESLMIPPSIFAGMEASLNTINFPVQFCKSYSQFKDILAKSEEFADESLTEILQNTELQLTLFLPVNNSFDQSSIDGFENVEYYFLFTNHMVDGRILENELEGAFTTKSGIGIIIDENGIISSPVEDEPFEALISHYNAFDYNNGIIHEIDGLFTNPGIKFSSENIYNTISNDPQYSDFIDLVTGIPSLLEVLQSTEDITAFIPDNQAFEKLRVTLNIESLQEINPAIIEAVLKYHVHTGGEIRRYEMSESTALSTIQGEEITFNETGNIANGGSDTDVEFTDLATKTSNGIIHPIETILIPPSIFAGISAILGKVSQTIMLSADFTTLASAIQKADQYAQGAGIPLLSEILADPNLSLTVFAPVNQVFEQAGVTLDFFTGQEWYGIIANHILDTKKLRTDFVVGNANPTLAGGAITLLPSGGLDSDYSEGAEATFINEAADIEMSNGVVHGIAGILIKPEVNVSSENIYSTIAGNPEYSDFENLISNNPNLVEILQTGDGLTVFVPNNQAFEKLRLTLGVETLESINPDIIAAVLSYHIHTEGELRREEMSESTSLSTVQGENITFNANNNIETGGSDSDVEFIDLATIATNGIVHQIETVLIPPSVFTIVSENLGKVSQTILLGADFSILSNAIQKSDEYASNNGITPIYQILAGVDPVTVFAPVNQVFEAAGITLDAFTAEQWYGIIVTHLVAGDLSSETIASSLQQGDNTLATFAGANVQVTPSEFQGTATLAIGGAPIVAADIVSENGRVQAIAGIVSSVNSFRDVLLGGQGNSEPNFYNTLSNIRYSYAVARDESGGAASPVDFAYFYGNTSQSALASIDSEQLNLVYDAIGLPIDGVFATRNSTRFRATIIDPQQFDGIIFNSQLEAVASSENSTNLSVTNLQVGSVVAFSLDASRGGYVGLLKVVEVNDTDGSGTITIEVKVQVAGN